MFVKGKLTSICSQLEGHVDMWGSVVAPLDLVPAVQQTCRIDADCDFAGLEMLLWRLLA